mgnify:CR=1 FL=1
MLLPVAILAQGEAQPGVVITTTPPGAQVTLGGEATVSGVAPVHFRQPLIGDYRLTVEKPGWETYKSKLVLDPTKQIAVAVELARKTPLKAAARSFFIPGWGQKYAGEPAKATAFFAAAVGSGLAFLWADNKFDDKRAILNERQREFDRLNDPGSGATQNEIQAAWELQQDARSEARDAEDVRRVTIGLAAGVWVLNMIDVLFFFPDEENTFSIKGVSVTPGAVNGGVGVTLSTAF